MDNMMNERLLSLWEYFRQISVVGSITLLHRLCSALQKSYKTGKISYNSLRTALKSEFNFETIKTDVSKLVILGLISSQAVHEFKFDPIKVAFGASYLMLMLQKKEKDDIAVGLAWSYYFGYLKIILPTFVEKTNTSKYKDDLIKKLFILIPADCKVYDDLEKAGQDLKFAESLGDTKEDVAGIKQRRYTNAVYQVKVKSKEGKEAETKEFYAAIEYATPLKTLNAMSNYAEAEFSRPERDRQVNVFRQTITEIMQKPHDCPEMKDRVVFVYLEDGMSIAEAVYNASLSSLSN